ncbi:hypothetical protein Barb6_02875 [Bacteroidales bacterium Barb6]|nr:hypothetical protein Barb6_02875 [Bacteroidales bacterium Barb6]
MDTPRRAICRYLLERLPLPDRIAAQSLCIRQRRFGEDTILYLCQLYQSERDGSKRPLRPPRGSSQCNRQSNRLAEAGHQPQRHYLYHLVHGQREERIAVCNRQLLATGHDTPAQYPGTRPCDRCPVLQWQFHWLRSQYRGCHLLQPCGFA